MREFGAQLVAEDGPGTGPVVLGFGLYWLWVCIALSRKTAVNIKSLHMYGLMISIEGVAGPG